jgi:hypothetical protein
MAQQTDPLASGLGTSEGKLTIALCLIGVALEALAASLASKVEQYPHLTWISITSLVVGAAVQVLSVLGYTKNRSGLKSNTIVQALLSGIPVVVTAVSNAVLKGLPKEVQQQALTAATAETAALAKEAPKEAKTVAAQVTHPRP